MGVGRGRWEKGGIGGEWGMFDMWRVGMNWMDGLDWKGSWVWVMVGDISKFDWSTLWVQAMVYHDANGRQCAMDLLNIS